MEGRLYRWTGHVKRYRKRWFVLSPGGVLSYYKTKATYYEVINQGLLGKGQLAVENCNMICDSKSLQFVLLERHTGAEIYLWSFTEEDRHDWIYALQECGANVMTMEEHWDLVYYGNLIPQLSFPTCEKEAQVRSMQQSDHSLLKNVGSAIYSILGGTVGAVIPGGTLIVDVIAMGAPKIFEFLKQHLESQSVAMNNLEKKIHLVLDAKLLNLEVIRVSTMLSGMENRLRQMRNPDSTLLQKQMEVPSVMQSCEEILKLFCCPDHVFYQHPLVMSPYLVHFSYFFLWTSQLVRVLANNYYQGLEILLRKLVDCLNDYKTRGIEQRLTAVTQRNESKRAKAITVSKGIALAPAWFFIDPEKYRFANEKVVDSFYPSKGLGTNYQYDVEYSVSSSLLDKYKQQLKEKYEKYFDNVIVGICDMIKLLDQIGDKNRVLELEN